MGHKNLSKTPITSEFLSDNHNNHNQNEEIRDKEINSGCFVTTKKALALAIFAILSLIFVIIFMYYYGPNKKLETIQTLETDLENILKQGIEQKRRIDIRLSKNIAPIHYNLKLHPIIDEFSEKNFTLTGHVRILVKCFSKTNKIALNWDNLNITESIKIKPATYLLHRYEDSTPLYNETEGIRKVRSVSKSEQENNSSATDLYLPSHLTNSTGTTNEDGSFKIFDQYMDKKSLKLFIELQESLHADKNYTIDIKFSGKINTNLNGLYRTSYNDSKGQNHWILTTQMQPIFARRVFPCFDEPSFKATFQLTLARRKNMTALSNMPIKTTETMLNNSDWVWDSFETTPPMSTYLLAFIISDFTELRCSNCIKNISVWTAPDDLKKAHYALECANQILKNLEIFFDMEYPISKLDLVAIPGLGKKAVENWGLVFFRKSALLYDPSKDSAFLQTSIFNTIAKVLSLQWLGNLVSIEWWDNNWLKGSLANFMVAILEKQLKPDWKTFNNYPLIELHNALFLDSLRSAHSVHTDIVDNEQIEQIADATLYDKGSSLLRMLNYTMTQPVFQRALQNYIRKFAYSTADADNFWECLSLADNSTNLPSESDIISLRLIMDSWVYQAGYPCITVNNTGSQVIFSQQKFVDANKTDDNTLWYVPLSYVSENSNGTKKQLWLNSEPNITINVDGGNNSWILVNIHQAGFYRVNYDTRNWQLLKNLLETDHKMLSVSNRAQLLDDAFELAKMSSIGYGIPFGLTKYLRLNEAAYIVWRPTFRNLRYIRNIMNYHEYTGVFNSFLINLVAKRFNLLGTRPKVDESVNDKLLRLDITKLACQISFQPCIEWTQKELKKWMNEPDPDKINPIPIDYREIIQCIAIQHGGRKEWNFLWERTYSPNILPEDQKVIYLSLGCTHDPWLINRYLYYSLKGNITLENVPLVWKSLNHPAGIRTAFPYLRLNWESIYQAYRDSYFIISSIIDDFLSNLATEIDIEDLTQFYKLHIEDLEPYANAMQITVNKIKLRVEWKKKHLHHVVSWLDNNK